jgi:GAF domain-containing protein
MSKDSLQSQLEDLFSSDVPEPTVTPAVPPEEEHPPQDVRVLSPVLEEGEASQVPPASGQGERTLERGRAHILNLLLGGAMIGGAVAVLALIAGIVQDPARLPRYVPFLAGYALIVAAFALRRVPASWRVAVFIFVTYVVALFSVLENGVLSTAPWYLLTVPLLFFILVGERAGVVSALVNALLYVGLAMAHRLGWLQARTAIDLAENASQFRVVSATFVLIIIVVVVVQWLFVRGQRQITTALLERSTALRKAQVSDQAHRRELELANETLQRQAMHLGLGIQLGRISTEGLTLEAYADRATSLIYERLNQDYVGLFLLDEEQLYAVLQASRGKGVEAMLPGHARLAVTESPLLEQCVRRAQAQMALNIERSNDPSTQDVFLLHGMGSAVALPLVAPGQVIGAITVQSEAPTAFRDDDLVTLRAVADQVSMAISNAQLSEELGERLREMEIMQARYVREAWESFAPTRDTILYEYEQPGVPTWGDSAWPDLDRPLSDPGLAIAGMDESSAQPALFSPIRLRDTVLGVLGLHLAEPDQAWTDDQIELIEAVSDQMALIIENSRLFEEARARAVRERQARQITARMRETLDVENVLGTAADEMYRALGLDEIVIRLTTGEAGDLSALGRD